MNPAKQTVSLNGVAKILLIGSLVIVSVVTWWFSYRAGLATTYNDAMSHLDIARLVIDSKQPGLTQLGSVWLPLNHILDLTLIWNTWAWHSGFAGSFFSMLAYVFSAIGIYAIVMELTDNIWASLVGGMAFALNPNILYLQTTPLTEPLYLVLVIASILYIIKFFKTDNLRYILLAGIFGFLQVLARYDGWFVVFVEGLVLLYHQRVIAKRHFQEAAAKLLLFAMPIIFAALLWLTWNALIFGSPLYFILGPYSAHAQQANIQKNAGLITKGNITESLLAYWYSISANIGAYITSLSLLGAALFLSFKNKTASLKIKTLVCILLLSPIVFNIIALYLGFSILNLPALHWNPSQDPAGQWFNVRYGIMALPFVAVFVGLLADFFKKKILIALIAILVIAQAFLVYQQGLITVTDGTIGSSSFVDNDVAQVLAENVQPGQNVLMSVSFFNAVSFKSNLPLKDFIYEGVSDEWTEALAHPENYTTWIVMANGDVGDPVYTALRTKGGDSFLKEYKLAYAGAHANVYELRTPDETFVSANGSSLFLGDSVFAAKGVNSYDLAYQSTSTIDTTFKNLSSIGVNTVRFWMFGDGNSDGFQPSAGIMNEARFENADYVIADARVYHIRLIPVLVNNWTDYGGVQQYLSWTGQQPSDQDAFYTNPATISLFENYINHVVTRKNTITGISYSNDPTIMAWEIINEPRFSDDQNYINWFAQVAQYIKQKDPNHLITVETDDAGADYCAVLPVDICTEHLYLYNNTTPIYPTLAAAAFSLQQYIGVTHRDDKPFLLSEVGVSKETNPFGENPVTILKDLVDANSGSGSLIWNWSNASDTSYGFSPFGTNGIYTLKDLSNVLGGTKPAKIYFTPVNSGGGGYDVSTPEIEENTISTTSLQIPPSVEVASATVNTESTIIPVGIPTPPAVSTTSIPAQGTGVSQTQPKTQTITVNKSLPYSAGPFSPADWIDGWGSSSVFDGVLSIGSNASNTSGALFLSGTNFWTNYKFTADVQWVKGDLFSMVVRRTDNSDMLNCVFSNINTSLLDLSINRVANNQNELMGDGQVYINTAAHIDENDIEVSMTVNGPVVSCSIDNATIDENVNNGVPPNLMAGGVGFETWDSQPGNSEIVVKQISITPLN